MENGQQSECDGGATMPTTLPSPVDLGGFVFLAVDGAGRTWRWANDELVWVLVEARGKDGSDGEDGAVH